MSAIYAFLMLASAQQPAATTPPPAPPPCASKQHAAFDFWVGEWDVYPNGSEKLAAHSRIERLYDGCAVRENWMPLKGAGGGSLNSYEAETGQWHQTWIGASPGRVEFVGGATQDGKMVLTGLWKNIAGRGKHALIRMTYSKVDDGAVRQHGEASRDHGLTWTTSFDFIYRRRKEPLPK
ncbi:MAG: hypothetical protein V3V15_06995 [Sphingorhabdus sp.]